MRRLLALLAVLLAAGVAPAAQGATTLVGPSERLSELERWIDVNRLPTPDAEISVTDSDCAPAWPGRSCARPGEILLEPDAWRDVFIHELGHQADYLELDDVDREAFLELVDHPGPWRIPGDPESSPSECFATAYAALSMRRRFRDLGFYYPEPCVRRAIRARRDVKALVRGALR